MKAVLTYSLTMFKRFLRDPVYLFFMFAFPLIFLFIFGTIFGGNDNVNFNIALINRSDTEFAKTFVRHFDSEDNTAFTVDKEITDIEAAKEKMSRGEISSIVELPTNFGAVDMTASPPLPSGEVQVYYDEGSPQTGQTVASIMGGVIDGINSEMTGARPALAVKPVSTGASGLTQFDYTFAGLLSYVLMTMGIYMLSQQLPAEKKAGALRRIKATPFRPWQMLSSLALVYLALTLLSAALMIAVGVGAFGFQMRGSWLVLAVFSVISTLTMIGFGAIVAGAARNSNQATMASQLVAFPMMFLSGVFFPRLLMPDWLQAVTDWIPLTPVGDGIRYITTENASLIDVLPQIGLIAAWGIAAYFVAFKVFKWE
jgi:ABC-2 type transport system permease protein